MARLRKKRGKYSDKGNGVLVSSPEATAMRVYRFFGPYEEGYDPFEIEFTNGYGYGNQNAGDDDKDEEGNKVEKEKPAKLFVEEARPFSFMGSETARDKGDSYPLFDLIRNLSEYLDPAEVDAINNGYHSVNWLSGNLRPLDWELSDNPFYGIDRLIGRKGGGTIVYGGADSFDDAIARNIAERAGGKSVIAANPSVDTGHFNESDAQFPYHDYAGDLYVGDLNKLAKSVAEMSYGIGEYEDPLLPEHHRHKRSASNIVLSKAALDNFKHSLGMKALESKLDGYEKDQLEEALKATDWVPFKRMLAEKAVSELDPSITNDNAKQYIHDLILGGRLNYFGDPELEGGPHGLFYRDSPEWEDVMFDKLVMAIMRTLGGTASSLHKRKAAHNIVLVSVMVPEARILSGEDILRGRSVGQKDFMHEVVVSVVIPQRIIARADIVLGNGGTAENYWLLRQGKMGGRMAWNATFGKLGITIKNDVSDERMKNVIRDDFCRSVRQRDTHNNICGALTRGPGNG